MHRPVQRRTPLCSLGSAYLNAVDRVHNAVLHDSSTCSSHHVYTHRLGRQALVVVGIHPEQSSFSDSRFTVSSAHLQPSTILIINHPHNQACFARGSREYERNTRVYKHWILATNTHCTNARHETSLSLAKLPSIDWQKGPTLGKKETALVYVCVWARTFRSQVLI